MLLREGYVHGISRGHNNALHFLGTTINYSMRAAFCGCISRRELFLLSLITVGQVSAPDEHFTALLDMPFNRCCFTHTSVSEGID